MPDIETAKALLSAADRDLRALCNMTDADRFPLEVFGFHAQQVVEKSLKAWLCLTGVGRLAQDNLHEEDTCFSGMFQGVLPHRRTFEFQVSKTGKVISGKVGKEVTDAAAINRILYKSVKINVHSRSVGEGLPRYILTGYGESTISDE